MNQEEYFLRNHLSHGEQIVYQYLKAESERSGCVKKSMKQMAKEILERYYEQISKSTHQKEDKTFSEATVHRAIRKLTMEGIIGILPSKDKSESNTILFYGLPEEDQLFGELVYHVEQLNQQMHRLQSVLHRKNHQLEQLKRDREHLHSEIDELLETYEELSETKNVLAGLLQDSCGEDNVLGKRRVISAEELPGGLIALILQQ